MREESVPPTTPAAYDEVYQALRPLLFSLAYRMIGSVGEAEDIVQEAFLRYHRALAEGTEIAAPKAFLTTVATRLAIDAVRSARARHEAYVGVWLPEPLAVSLEPDPAEHAEMNDTLSLAFLVLLQALSPLARAVFLLREVFDYGYDEIASIVQKSEDNCRQIFARAKKHIDAGKPRYDADPARQREFASRFFAAADRGDMRDLVTFLAEDAAFYGDGGGKAHAYPQPVVGRRRVALVFKSLFKSARDLNIAVRYGLVNGQPGVVSFDPDGRIISAMALVIRDGVVQAVHSMVNPDKLARLGFPVSDMARMSSMTRG